MRATMLLVLLSTLGPVQALAAATPHVTLQGRCHALPGRPELERMLRRCRPLHPLEVRWTRAGRPHVRDVQAPNPQDVHACLRHQLRQVAPPPLPCRAQVSVMETRPRTVESGRLGLEPRPR